MEHRRLQHQLQFPHRYTTGGVGPSPRPPDILYLPHDFQNPAVLVAEDRSFLHGKGAGSAEGSIEAATGEIHKVADPSPMETGEAIEEGLEKESLDDLSAKAIAEKVASAKTAAASKLLKVGRLHWSPERKEGGGKRKPEFADPLKSKKPRNKLTFN
jgi:hypothetical protein